MDRDKLDLIESYRQHIQKAHSEFTKKEHFKDLLNRLYKDSPEIRKILDKMSHGAEKAVLNIPREDRLHRGAADTLYNKIIIEFEYDLGRTLDHAKEQLAGYLLGEFNSGEGYNHTLIVSDFIEWRVYAPVIDDIEELESMTESELQLEEKTTFKLTEKNGEDFYYWIDSFLFKKEKLRATLERMEESFGHQSHVFIESLRQLTKHFREAKKYGEVQVSFEQWSKFLSIAYGSFDASERNYLIHTYLSIFAKMLAYSVITNDRYIDESELQGIIDGSVFDKYNIRNFVDNDFYHWVKNESSFRELKKVFRLISQEISSFDFDKVDEDVLKGVYQELIDIDTRHALGEYYTPDWLCERILKEFEPKPGEKFLDPACGSGSFLRAAFHRIRELNPDMSVEDLNDSIYGIDIHPLSVQIAKTTMLLAMGREILKSRRPIQINVILANTLRSPDGVETIFGKTFKMEIDRDTLVLSSKILDDVKTFDTALDTCEELADQTLTEKDISREVFGNILKKHLKTEKLDDKVIESFHDIYKSFKKAKKQGRDSIWRFIVENLYKPYFLMGKFDYVIGNPPWFTYSTIKNKKYQDLLNELAVKYNVKPESVANFPHLEIAAIFLAYCADYFLSKSNEIAFVLPRSFFSASSHDNTRSGKAEGYKLTEIWDLKDVSPLFRIPSCVLFGEKSDKKAGLPESGMTGKSFSGNIPAHNCNLEIAEEHLTETDEVFYYRKMGTSTAFTTSTVKVIDRVNPY
ncbi:MAG: Eco57I restriction-modification methylase domain-containing protein, partial [bacterium]